MGPRIASTIRGSDILIHLDDHRITLGTSVVTDDSGSSIGHRLDVIIDDIMVDHYLVIGSRVTVDQSD